MLRNGVALACGWSRPMSSPRNRRSTLSRTSASPRRCTRAPSGAGPHTRARRLKLDAEVVGARTARYYVPSAFLREFAAILKGHLLLHVVLFTPFVALAGYFFLLYLD